MNDDAMREGDPRDVIANVPLRPGAAVMPVSLFVSSARLLLERHLGLAWIGGEISGCTRAASGHFYFTLKDAKAQVRCVFFRHKAQGLSFALRDGLGVEVRAVASIYEPRGEFQLVAEEKRQEAHGGEDHEHDQHRLAGFGRDGKAEKIVPAVGIGADVGG